MKRILLCLVLALGCSKKEPAAPPSYPVQVTQVQMRKTPLYIEALGHVESIDTVQIRSRIEGELMEVHFVEGQEVKKGDLLFSIDPRPYQATLKSQQALLEESLANLAIAEEKVRRYAQLTKDDYYSQIDYETLQTNFATAAASVKANEANVDSAALNLDYCWIYSPIDGLAGILQIDKGNLISQDGQNALITLNRMTPIYVTFSIPEMKLPEVQKAHRQEPLVVEAAFESFRNECFTGKLQMFDNAVDTSTGMIKLRAIFLNADRALWPGQFVRTRLILRTLDQAVLIPAAAIQQTLSGPIVYVVKPDSTVKTVKVKLGQREDTEIIVVDGLKGDEILVLEGQLNLFDGAKVFIP